MVSVSWIYEDWGISTTESVKFIRKLFPSHYPWGQGCLPPGGIVMDLDTDELSTENLGKEAVMLGKNGENEILLEKEEKIAEVIELEVLTPELLLSEEETGHVSASGKIIEDDGFNLNRMCVLPTGKEMGSKDNCNSAL